MVSPEEKSRRARRRADTRRKNLRDALPKLHKDTKENNKKKKYHEDTDGEVSR